LKVTPSFNEFHLIDLDGDKTAELRRQVGSQENIFIYEGDANQILLEKIFPRCRYKDFARALCLLDPYALNVDWSVLRKAGEMGSIEVFYNFMIMDANMNILKHDRDEVASAQVERMDKAWGDRTWENIAYYKKPTLFGGTVDAKYGNETVAEGFRQRLETVAGFKYVPKPISMRNKNSTIIYYLYFASPNKTGAKIVDDIFGKYRARGLA
jgi:three-Cys-motif partner protein